MRTAYLRASSVVLVLWQSRDALDLTQLSHVSDSDCRRLNADGVQCEIYSKRGASRRVLVAVQLLYDFQWRDTRAGEAELELLQGSNRPSPIRHIRWGCRSPWIPWSFDVLGCIGASIAAKLLPSARIINCIKCLIEEGTSFLQ